MATLTPMMQQYMDVKQKHSDCIVLFRLGDFYEMFFDDAKLVSKELELTLTGKDCGLQERAPMCGVPYHAAATYISRLVENGHKVAICEQLTDPALSKGLVERDVIRIITPGTVVDPAMLDEKSNSYVLCVYLAETEAQLAYADVSTGEFVLHQLKRYERTLRDELTRIQPHEIIANDREALLPFLPQNVAVSQYPAYAFERKVARECLLSHFGLTSLTPLGVEDGDKRLRAAGALMRYLSDTQKNALEHITKLTLYQDANVMFLDRVTRRNLELTESLRTGDRKGSLLWLLDRTETAMGARMLRGWVEQPLIDREAIERRLDAVDALRGDVLTSEEIGHALEQVYDLERLLSKVAYRSLNARDCLALQHSLGALSPIRELLAQLPRASALVALRAEINPLPDLTDLLTRAIHPDAPLTLAEGGVIADGYSRELDDYRQASTLGKQWILDLETAERKETGIKNLKVQYNRVFGFYIEVTKSNLGQVPLRYTRRQTLANSERYITPELQDLERKILGAQQSALTLEMQLFGEVRDAVAARIHEIQQNAEAVKALDALLSLARVARENGYVRPAITEDGVIRLQNARHPIVERATSGDAFVPNDALLDGDANRMLIITGPNMAGKSTYMRQVALCVLMAHMGSFVPAEKADVSTVDRVFTRIGASDDLAGGQSTFMVEMSETASILRNATSRSLILLDEIGRGTSTFDGLSIAWAVVEYLLDKKKIGAKTLFATHYHELSELEGRLEGVKNYCISVKEHGEDIIFLRKIIPGGADRSYGVHVAHLAGIPNAVVMRANEIQARLEASDINQNTIGQNILEKRKKQDRQTDLFHLPQDDLIEELQNLDVMSLTPIDALNALFRLREKARVL